MKLKQDLESMTHEELLSRAKLMEEKLNNASEILVQSTLAMVLLTQENNLMHAAVKNCIENCPQEQETSKKIVEEAETIRAKTQEHIKKCTVH